MSKINVTPAITLLQTRARTNGYADQRDLAEACGIDWSAALRGDADNINALDQLELVLENHPWVFIDGLGEGGARRFRWQKP